MGVKPLYKSGIPYASIVGVWTPKGVLWFSGDSPTKHTQRGTGFYTGSLHGFSIDAAGSEVLATLLTDAEA